MAPDLTAQLRAHAEATHPHECCGLLLGRRMGRAFDVDAYAQSANLAVDPVCNFEIDPGLHIRLQRELRGTGRAVIGVFHSHPAGPAEPSVTDRARAAEPGFLWLISGQGGALAAYVAPARPGAPFQALSLEAGENPPPSSPHD